MNNKPYRNAVGIAFYQDNKIFLARKDRPAHAWQLPQGGVDPGETLEQGIIRETFEELRLKIQNPTKTDIIYTYEWLNPTEVHPIKDKYRGQIVKFFLHPMPADQTPKFGMHDEAGEPVEGKLVTLEEALDLVESEQYKEEVIRPLYALISQS